MSQFENAQQLLKDIKSVLDQSAESIDQQTLVLLKNARRQALQASQVVEAVPMKLNWLAPISGLAVAASIIIIIGSLWINSPVPIDAPSAARLDDLDLLVSGDSLEFYENLDFMAWLEYENKSG